MAAPFSSLAEEKAKALEAELLQTASSLKTLQYSEEKAAEAEGGAKDQISELKAELTSKEGELEMASRKIRELEIALEKAEQECDEAKTAHAATKKELEETLAELSEL